MRGATALLLGICLLSLMACGGKKKTYYYFDLDEGLDSIRPYVSDGPYSATLKACAINGCTLEALPVLGMDAEAPSVEDIMSRVLVSHSWMGERLQQVLDEAPDDLLLLFRSTTAVVIDDDIRPSFYHPATGAIYLDPDYLWLTSDERATVSDQPDFRGSYIHQMAYRPLWRYRNGPGDRERSLDSIVVQTAHLLFHELAHATDRFPLAFFDSVDRSQPIHSVISALEPQATSRLLDTHYPLKSQVMFDLASIIYQGAISTPAYRAMTAAEVGQHFASDNANDDYNYASLEEDVAMLFEEAMMKIHFNMDRDIGFAHATNSPYCADNILGWGMRNRLGAEGIKVRAQWVVEQLLPERDYSLYFDTFPEPRELQVGVSWCDSDTSSPIISEKAFFTDLDDERMINPRHLRPSGGLPR